MVVMSLGTEEGLMTSLGQGSLKSRLLQVPRGQAGARHKGGLKKGQQVLRASQQAC